MNGSFLPSNPPLSIQSLLDSSQALPRPFPDHEVRPALQGQLSILILCWKDPLTYDDVPIGLNLDTGFPVPDEKTDKEAVLYTLTEARRIDDQVEEVDSFPMGIPLPQDFCDLEIRPAVSVQDK